MASASRAAASRPTSSEAVRYLAGGLVALEEDSVDVDIPRPCRFAQLAQAASVVVSADAEVASEEETEGSGEGSIDPGAEVSVVATVASAAKTVVTAVHLTHRVDLATAEVDLAAVLTVVTAGTTVVAVAMEDATTTSSAAAAAAAVIVVTIDPAQEATQSRLAHDTAAPVAAPPVVGIATETTAATTPASDLTREAQVTKANANFDDTDDKTTAGLVVGILSPLISLFSSSHTSLSSSTTRVSKREASFFLDRNKNKKETLVTLDHTLDQGKAYQPILKRIQHLRPLGGI